MKLLIVETEVLLVRLCDFKLLHDLKIWTRSVNMRPLLCKFHGISIVASSSL